MHSPKFLCCACLGTKWGSVGSDCVSNLDINRQGWESTLLPCSCQFASGSLVRIPTYPVTTGAARARGRHGRENLKHFCVWDSKPLTLRGLLVSSTFSCLKLPKKSILRNWKYTITQKKKSHFFFFFLAFYHLPQTSVTAEESLYIWTSCDCSLHTKWIA